MIIRPLVSTPRSTPIFTPIFQSLISDLSIPKSWDKSLKGAQHISWSRSPFWHLIGPDLTSGVPGVPSVNFPHLTLPFLSLFLVPWPVIQEDHFLNISPSLVLHGPTTSLWVLYFLILINLLIMISSNLGTHPKRGLTSLWSTIVHRETFQSQGISHSEASIPTSSSWQLRHLVQPRLEKKCKFVGQQKLFGGCNLCCQEFAHKWFTSSNYSIINWVYKRAFLLLNTVTARLWRLLILTLQISGNTGNFRKQAKWRTKRISCKWRVFWSQFDLIWKTWCMYYYYLTSFQMLKSKFLTSLLICTLIQFKTSSSHVYLALT